MPSDGTALQMAAEAGQVLGRVQFELRGAVGRSQNAENYSVQKNFPNQGSYINSIN